MLLLGADSATIWRSGHLQISFHLAYQAMLLLTDGITRSGHMAYAFRAPFPQRGGSLRFLRSAALADRASMSPLSMCGRQGWQAQRQEHPPRHLQVLRMWLAVHGQDRHRLRVEPPRTASLASGDLPSLLRQAKDKRAPASADPRGCPEDRLGSAPANSRAHRSWRRAATSRRGAALHRLERALGSSQDGGSDVIRFHPCARASWSVEIRAKAEPEGSRQAPATSAGWQTADPVLGDRCRASRKAARSRRAPIRHGMIWLNQTASSPRHVRSRRRRHPRCSSRHFKRSPLAGSIVTDRSANDGDRNADSDPVLDRQFGRDEGKP